MPDHGLRRIDAPEPIEPSDDHAELVLFWNEGCTHCRAMIEGLHDRADTLDRGPSITFVVASEADGRTAVDRIKSAAALVDPQMKLSLGLGVPGTPSAALVGPDHRLRSDLAVGPDAIFAVLDQSTDLSRGL